VIDAYGHDVGTIFVVVVQEEIVHARQFFIEAIEFEDEILLALDVQKH
jgi:hypothetical protein